MQRETNIAAGRQIGRGREKAKRHRQRDRHLLAEMSSGKGTVMQEMSSRKRDNFAEVSLGFSLLEMFSGKIYPVAGNVFWGSIVPVRDLYARCVVWGRGPVWQKCHLGKTTPLLEVFSGKVDLFIGSVVLVRGPLSRMCSLGKGSLCRKRRLGRRPPLSEVSSGKGDRFAGSFF